MFLEMETTSVEVRRYQRPWDQALELSLSAREGVDAPLQRNHAQLGK